MPAEKTLNPLDVERLEKSLNDSATRVSTIWISYLLFGLYLLVSAGTATDRQLLLADSVKLPALGTEVPLVSFFIISPVLFVLLQFYVLLQTLLLGRTAQAYNDALDRSLKMSSDNAIFRERLANTIFAQIFAGAPRERDGWVGSILLGITWFTLIVSPILVLLTFQLAFLPYHSQEVTWIHRLLIYAELVIFFTLWPAVMDPAKEFDWHSLDLRIWRSTLWSQKQAGQLTAILILVLSTFLFSFPGEWHINLLSGRNLESRECTGWLPDAFGLSKIDRLVLKDVGIGGAETSQTTDDLSKAASLRDWSYRDFACGIFVGVDFRRTILDYAHLEGGVLTKAKFDSTTGMVGIVLEDADLSGRTLYKINLTGAHLKRAKLSGATLTEVDLSRADLTGIDLSGATLTDAKFEEGAYLSGANLIRLEASGLTLTSAHLEGASLQYSTLRKSNLQGAILDGADLYGATLVETASDWASDKGIFNSMPPDWVKQPAEQEKFANEVADTVCTEGNPKNVPNRSEIVTAIVTNALYPNRNDPACPKQDPASSSCPPEQPKEYRNALAKRLSACASTILSRKDIDDLRSGFGHPGRKQ